MSPFWKVITREEAEQLYEQLATLETEQNHIQEVLDRVLAEDIISDVDVPHFSRSNMDGYALRAEDTYGATETSPVKLKVIGEVEMGKTADVSVLMPDRRRTASAAKAVRFFVRYVRSKNRLGSW